MERYFQVTVTGPAHEMRIVEQLSQTQYGCDGVEEFSMNEAQVDGLLGERAFSGGDIPQSLIDEVDHSNSAQDLLSFIFYFYQAEAEKRLENFSTFLAEYPQIKYSVEEKAWQDWNSEWRKHYRPLVVSPNLTIIPEWLRKDDDGPGSVYIYPGMGFGTGSHETTFLCLCALEKLINIKFPITQCLDFGCGSGILGVSAIERAGAFVDFCDIDRQALDNTLQNLQLNFQADRLQGHALVSRDRFKLEKTYDLVFANILQHILIQEIDTISTAVRQGGYLVLSGVLNHQVADVITAYKKSGLRLEEILSRGEWSAILMRRRD